jgi:cytochrome c biogenesis protein CcdA
MVTTVSPCGIAMLPAYISLYMQANEKGFWNKSPLWRCARALVVSGVATLGFMTLFGAIGAILAVGGQFLIAFIPWIAILISVALILLGSYLLFRGHLYVNLPAQLVVHLGKNSGMGIKGFFIFGIAYGLAALSCTLPVFLVVVGSTLATKGFTSGLFQFISFALGMGFIITMVSLGSVLFKETANRWLRCLAPLVTQLSGLLLIFAGSYILYFWFIIGELLS